MRTVDEIRNTIITGDALTVLKTIPDGVIQCCITSPPYWGLRDYGEGGIGGESSLEEWVVVLTVLFSEVRRVLRADGTLWLNLGDRFKKDKNLMGQPWRLAFALNDAGWYLRSEIIWGKPNCVPESVSDRPTREHETIFLMTKNSCYYYDSDAIRVPNLSASKKRRESPTDSSTSLGRHQPGSTDVRHRTKKIVPLNPLGRHKRTIWNVPSYRFPGAHSSTFPPGLVELMVLAGSKPSDLILDPFMGSGTTAVVAKQHGRDCVGIELNPEYAEMAIMRIKDS